MKFAVVELKREHLHDFLSSEGMERNQLDAYVVPGLSYAAISEHGEVVGIFGLVNLRVGVVEAWAAMKDSLREHPLFMHRFVKRKLIDLRGKFHRIQCFVFDGYQDGLRWAESLGFQREGIEHSFLSPGKNCWRLAIWRETV